MKLAQIIYSFIFLLASVITYAQPADSIIVSVNTNMSTYISGDTHDLSVGIVNSNSTDITVDVFLAKMLTDGSLVFVQYDLSKSVATLTDNLAPVVTNLIVPSGMNLQNFGVLSQIISDKDPFGQYTWYFALTTPGTTNIISNIASSPFQIDSIANILSGSWSGAWLGTWVDGKVNKVSGATSIKILPDEKKLNSTGSISLDSIFIPDASGSATGTITDNIGNNLTFLFDARLLGSGAGSFRGRKITGSGAILPSIGFGPFNIEGSLVDGDTICLTFNYTNTNRSGTGKAHLKMTKN